MFRRASFFVINDVFTCCRVNGSISEPENTDDLPLRLQPKKTLDNRLRNLENLESLRNCHEV